jgi:hypothetical protein
MFAYCLWQMWGIVCSRTSPHSCSLSSKDTSHGEYAWLAHINRSVFENKTISHATSTRTLVSSLLELTLFKNVTWQSGASFNTSLSRKAVLDPMTRHPSAPAQQLKIFVDVGGEPNVHSQRMSANGTQSCALAVAIGSERFIFPIRAHALQRQEPQDHPPADLQLTHVD